MATMSPIKIPIVGIDKFTTKMRGIEKRLKKFASGMDQVGKKLTTSVTLPAVAMGGAIVKSAYDFDVAINTVEAKAAKGSASMEQLREKAKQIGTETQFSFIQAAQGMEEMAAAGSNTGEIFKGILPVMQLSAATNYGVAESVDLATNVMNAWGLTAKELPKISAQLATGVASGAIDMQNLSDTMVYASSSASTWGDSIADVTALTAALGSVNIKGSVAGTAIANTYNRIGANTAGARDKLVGLGIAVKDATGAPRRMLDILTDLGKKTEGMKKFKKMAIFQDVFGQRAFKLGAKMSENLLKVEGNVKTLGDQLQNVTETDLQNMVNIMNKGSVGPIRRFISAIQGAGLAIAESGLLDAVAWLADKLAIFFQRLAKTSPKLLKFGTIVVAVAAALGPLLIVLGAVVASVAKFAVIWPAIKIAIATVLGPFSVLWLALAGMVAIIYKFRKSFEPVIQILKESFKRSIDIVARALKPFINSLMDLWGVFFDIDMSGQGDMWQKAGFVMASAMEAVAEVVAGLVKTLNFAIDGYKELAALAGVDAFKGDRERTYTTVLEGMSDKYKELLERRKKLTLSGEDPEKLQRVERAIKLSQRKMRESIVSMDLGPEAFKKYIPIPEKLGAAAAADITKKTAEKSEIVVKFQNPPPGTEVVQTKGKRAKLTEENGPIMGFAGAL